MVYGGKSEEQEQTEGEPQEKPLLATTKINLESHIVNYAAFIQDDFDTYFIDRAKAIMKVIEGAI